MKTVVLSLLLVGNLFAQNALGQYRVVQGKVYDFSGPYDMRTLPWFGLLDRMPGPVVVQYKVDQVCGGGLLAHETRYTALNGTVDGDQFFLTNYPNLRTVTDNQIISFVALRIGNYRGTTVLGATITVPLYDCGTPYVPPPPTPEEIAAANEKKEEAANKAYKAQERDIQRLQPQATNGDDIAQYSLGLHYLEGKGCESNLDTAIYWLKKAADHGNDLASDKLADDHVQYSFGLRYLEGNGCELSRSNAIYWLKKAADQGNIAASNKLATVTAPQKTQ